MGAQATKKCSNCSNCKKEQQKYEQDHSFEPPPIEQSKMSVTKDVEKTNETTLKAPNLPYLLDIESQQEQGSSRVEVQSEKEEEQKPLTFWQSILPCLPRQQEKKTSWDQYQHGEGHQTLKWQNFHTDYILGKGSLAQVFLGQFKAGEIKKGVKRCAIKRMKKKIVKTKQASEHIKIQKAIMRQCSSNFVTQLYGTFRDNEHYYLVMELAEGGDVYNFIKPDSPRTSRFIQVGEPAIRFILACVILGLEEVHKKNFIYNDLKPENLLIFADGYVKLADFGLAKYHKDEPIEIKACTPLYCPPEIMCRKMCGKQVDLWTIGIIAYELANHTCPFKVHDILDGEYFSFVVRSWSKHPQWVNTNISPQLKDLITQLLKFKPDERLGAGGNWANLKSHDFFDGAGFNWRDLQAKAMISPLLPIIKEKMVIEKVLDKDDEQDEDDLRWTEVLTIDNWSRLSG